jgi:hypothetical protein
MKSLFITITSFFGILFFPFTSLEGNYQSWNDNQNDFIKTYSSTFAFNDNMNYINECKNNSWKLGQNKFTGFDHNFFQMYYKGYFPIFSKKPTYIISNKTIPKNFDWRKNSIVAPVKDQQQCGSCWAFSAVSALESQVMKLTKTKISLSEQEMVDCVKNVLSPDGSMTCCSGCMGGEMYAVYQYLMGNQDGKDDTEQQYPYLAQDGKCKPLNNSVTSVKLTNYVSLNAGDEEMMLNALYHVGPLSVGVDANQDWQLYSKGIYNPTEQQCSSDPEMQDHGVAVVGYGTSNGLDYWIVRNSWGKDWGENGYMRIIRGKNACGIANSVIYPVVEKV